MKYFTYTERIEKIYNFVSNCISNWFSYFRNKLLLSLIWRILSLWMHLIIDWSNWLLNYLYCWYPILIINQAMRQSGISQTRFLLMKFDLETNYHNLSDFILLLSKTFVWLNIK